MFWRRWLNFVVGVFLSIITFGQKKPEAQQMRRMEYSTSTQRMGVRFTERLRDRWRRRWLKLRR